MRDFFGLAPAPPAAERIHEDLGTPLIDPDDNDFRGLGVSGRDLGGIMLQRAQDLCVGLYRANPIANRIIRIYVSFIDGRDTSVTGHNPEVTAVLDEFDTSPRSNFVRNRKGYARDYLLFGEGIHPTAVDEMGNTTLGFIDPTAVESIQRNPRNQMILDRLLIRRVGGTPEAMDIIKLDTDITSESAGFLTGEAFAFLFDRIAAASRGTPLLLPNLDWLDAYDQVLWEMLEREKSMRAYFWDVGVEGGKTQIDEAKSIFGTSPPKSGSVRFRSKSIEVKAESPQLGHYESVNTARYQLRNLATGAGIAPHWLSDPEDANRSTAETMDLPVLRNLVDVQDDWRHALEDIYTFVIDQKVRVGMLSATLPEMDENGNPTGEEKMARDLFTVNQPELESSKVETAATALSSIASAVIQLEMVQGIPGGMETVRKMVRSILPSLGVPMEDIPEDDGTFDSMLQARAAGVEEAMEALGA